VISGFSVIAAEFASLETTAVLNIEVRLNAYGCLNIYNCVGFCLLNCEKP